MQNKTASKNSINTISDAIANGIGRLTAKLFAKIFAGLLYIPGLRTLFKHRFVGACVYANGLIKTGNQNIALRHFMGLLVHQQFADAPLRWWYLMKQAVIITQAYQGPHSRGLIREAKLLIGLAERYSKYNKNHKDNDKNADKTYCYVTFGLWAFQLGAQDKARYYIQEAIKADKSWGYPEYLMGWLGLFDKRIDSVHHFVNALHYDWAFFHTIRRDTILQKNPEIIRQIRQKIVILKTGSNKCAI